MEQKISTKLDTNNMHQEARKKNIKYLIDVKESSSVDKFAKKIEKHRTYVYGLIKNIEDGGKTVTNKMARYIEFCYDLLPYSLDVLNLFESAFKQAIESNNISISYTANHSVQQINSCEVVTEGEKNTKELRDKERLKLSIDQELLDFSNYTKYNKLNIIKVLDDFMSPTIKKNDLVVFQHVEKITADTVSSGSIYLIKSKFDIRFLRIIKDLFGNIILKVDNMQFSEHFPLVTMNADQFNDANLVIGKAIYFISKAE